jgi:glycine dehydrogenase
MNPDIFSERHIGPRGSQIQDMLSCIGASSLEALIDETVPNNIRLQSPLKLNPPMSEPEYLEHIQTLGHKNKVFKSYIGMGYHPSNLPAVIQRNILENPGWYTAYTPYQAEIAQGRLEALLNFQTMVTDLTGMELANASLLDESTSAACLQNLQNKKIKIKLLIL